MKLWIGLFFNLLYFIRARISVPWARLFTNSLTFFVHELKRIVHRPLTFRPTSIPRFLANAVISRYKGGIAIACASPKVSALLFSSRRSFLRSLRRSSLVFSLEGVFALARPPFATAGAPKDLGVTFVDVARESGLKPRPLSAESIRINFCWRPPAAGSRSTTTTTTAGWTFFW